jgi:hypothetical protein
MLRCALGDPVADFVDALGQVEEDGRGLDDADFGFFGGGGHGGIFGGR